MDLQDLKDLTIHDAQRPWQSAKMNNSSWDPGRLKTELADWLNKRGSGFEGAAQCALPAPTRGRRSRVDASLAPPSRFHMPALWFLLGVGVTIPQTGGGRRGEGTCVIRHPLPDVRQALRHFLFEFGLRA